MKGQELGFLRELYVKNGFWQEDITDLHSHIWHRRLSALVRLDQWKHSLGLTTLLPAIEDENKQIRQIALKNLSRSREKSEASYLLTTVNRIRIDYSVLHEIIFRLIHHHKETVLNCLRDTAQRKLWPLIVKVIGDTRDIEAVPLLIELAANSQDIKTAEKAIIALGKIGDPRGLSALKRMVTAIEAPLRLASLHALMLIDSRELFPYKEHLKADHDPLIQNWMAHYERLGL